MITVSASKVFLVVVFAVVVVNYANCEETEKFSFPKVAHLLVKRCKNDFKDYQVQTMNPSKMKVGIVGAGFSGLYAAILLEDLGINYEILEASNRIGGRFYTHYFGSSSKYDYVELGAMRFPNLPEFERIIGNQKWSLVNYLNSKVALNYQLNLTQFKMSHPNNVFHFNGRSKVRSEVVKNGDLFGFSKKDGGFIDDNYADKNFMFWDKKASDYVSQKLNGSVKSGIDFLVKNDYTTYRGFLMKPENKELAYPSDVIDWIEAFDAQTGRFSISLMDSYLMFRFFNFEMLTIDGGASKIIEAMESVLQKKVKLETAVQRIKQYHNNDLIISTNRGYFRYTHIILTPLLPVLRDIHFDCNLHLKKRVAMRTVGSGMLLMKIGIKFHSRFWEYPELMNGKPIYGGASLTDLRIREVVYPSNGINCTSCPGILIVGYIQLKEAIKYVSFSDQELLRICLEDLSVLHGKIVYQQFSGDYKVMQWSKNKWQQGGFITFEPGHFANLYPYLIHPDANGRIHFAGDTQSIYHNWSIGSLVAAYRAVRDILTVNGMNGTIKKLEENWGTIDEPDFAHFRH